MKTFGIPIRDLQRLCELVKEHSEIADRYAEEDKAPAPLAFKLDMLEAEIVTEVLDLFDTYGWQLESLIRDD